MLSNLLENGAKGIEKCYFYIKYFNKIKCHADRLYLVFSELKPETHIYIIGFLRYMMLIMLRNARMQASFTIKIVNIQTPKTFAVITLKFEQDGFTKE